MATLKDVANLANVSTSTASRILHGGSIRVSPETRARVMVAAEQLKYRANSLARSLRTRVTRTIGFIIPDIQNPVYAQMIAGAEEAAQSAGYALLLMNSGSGQSRRAFIDLLSEDRVDGLAIADATLDDNSIEGLLHSGRAYVLVNRRTRNNAPYVILDDKAGASAAIQHLIDLGHREIAYFSGPSHIETTMQRLEGVRQTLTAAGIDLKPGRVIPCGFGGEGVEEAVSKLLNDDPAITAIAVGSIVIAFAALRCVLERGLRVPDDISIVGYHDTPLAAFVSPSITTVQMPLDELGRRAIRSIIERVDGEDGQSEVIRDPQPRLIVRQSTAGPKLRKA